MDWKGKVNMSIKRYIFYTILGLLTGLFIIPTILNWLGLPISTIIADLLDLAFGEPNWINVTFISLLGIIFLLFSIRGFYKGYKRSKPFE